MTAVCVGISFKSSGGNHWGIDCERRLSSLLESQPEDCRGEKV